MCVYLIQISWLFPFFAFIPLSLSPPLPLSLSPPLTFSLSDSPLLSASLDPLPSTTHVRNQKFWIKNQMATLPSGQVTTWPRQSRKLINHIVDDLARERPEALYAELPLSPTSFDEGFREVTYRDFSNAVNGMAWWLNRTLGPGQNFEALAYIGPNDMRHNILLLGAVKAGFKVGF